MTACQASSLPNTISTLEKEIGNGQKGTAEIVPISVKQAWREAGSLCTDNVCMGISRLKDCQRCKCNGSHGYNSGAAGYGVSVRDIKLYLVGVTHNGNGVKPAKNLSKHTPPPLCYCLTHNLYEGRYHLLIAQASSILHKLHLLCRSPA